MIALIRLLGTGTGSRQAQTLQGQGRALPPRAPITTESMQK